MSTPVIQRNSTTGLLQEAIIPDPPEYFTASQSTGATIAANKAVAFAGTGAIRLADSGAVNDYPVVGFTTAAIADNASGQVQSLGVLGGFSGLTPGALYFSDPANPGGITATLPNGVNQKSQIVGRAFSSSILYIMIEEPIAITGATSATSGITVANDSGAIVKQASYPGTQQSGANANIDGYLNAQGGLLSAGNYLNPTPKNWLINGNFDICQRYGPGGAAAITSAAFQYVLDRWAALRDVTGATITVSQQAFTPGQTAVPGEPTYFMRIAQTVAGSGGTYNAVGQPIEDVRSLAGQTVTVSFWAKADATRTITFNFDQNFGSGGSSSVTSIGLTSFNLNTSWQKFTYTTTLPSISGKTVGSGSRLTLFFSLPLNAVQTIDIAQVQLEAGANAGPFQKRTFAEELQACMRYYQKSFNYTVVPAQNNGTGRELFAMMSNGANPFWTKTFPVPMRAAPTMTYFSPSNASAMAWNYTRNNAAASTSTQATNPQAFEIAMTNGTGWATGDLLGLQWTAEAEL
jgi:hypothetical protein